MQRTAALQRADTTQAVCYVNRRVLGDLSSIHEKFGMSTVSELNDLAHDLEVGLACDCLSELRLFLYRPGAYQPSRVYIYRRTAIGSFSPSNHSGRIQRSAELAGGRLEYEVRLRDENADAWDSLREEGRLRIPWQPCNGRSLSGMTAKADGGYASGELGLSRTMYTR